MDKASVSKTENDATDSTRKPAPAGDAAAAKGSLPGNTNGNPNATPGAQTSGANAPRK